MSERSKACRSDDLTTGRSALWLWRLPWLLVVIGAFWPAGLFWLWIPSFLVAGSACVANARRCGRLHCYATGPLYLGAAAFLVLRLVLPDTVPFEAGVFLLVLVAASLAARVAERWLGRYTRSVERAPGS